MTGRQSRIPLAGEEIGTFLVRLQLPGGDAQKLPRRSGIKPAPVREADAVLAVALGWVVSLVPGSHKWHDQNVRQPPDVETVQVEMGAGSLLAWTGALWHGGGANTTKDQSRLAVDINFNLSYLRQQENQYIGVPREEVAKMPERLQRVLGYQQGMSIAGPGMVVCATR